MRQGKVLRMEQWLADRQLGWGDVESTFYSDSMNDVPLLEKSIILSPPTPIPGCQRLCAPGARARLAHTGPFADDASAATAGA